MFAMPQKTVQRPMTSARLEGFGQSFDFGRAASLNSSRACSAPGYFHFQSTLSFSLHCTLQDSHL